MRRFGVEIECGHKNYYWTNVQSLLKQAKIPVQSVGCDGSGIEVRTHPLKGYKGFSELKRIFDFLNSIGCTRNLSQDGLHIHHDAPEFLNNHELQARIVESWKQNEEIIHQFVNQIRQKRAKWDLDTLEKFKKDQVPADSRNNYNYSNTTRGPRGSINLWSLSEHGTIEIRLHEGTLNYQEAAAWIRFGQRFINHIINRKSPIGKLESPQQLLKRTRVSPNTYKLLMEKVGKAA